MQGFLRISILLISFIFIWLSSAFCAEDTISVTTFYPSPYGAYTELRTNKMKIGSTYFGDSVAFIDDGLIVEGNVGIGTASPGLALDVAGTINVTAFKMETGAGNNKVLTSDADGVGTWEDYADPEVDYEFGGMFTQNLIEGPGVPPDCHNSNPFTGDCTCPPEYTEYLAFTDPNQQPGGPYIYFCAKENP